MKREARVIVIVQPLGPERNLPLWQWPQAEARVIAIDDEQDIIPDAIANEARIAARKAMRLGMRLGETLLVNEAEVELQTELRRAGARRDPHAALRNILGECREYTVYQHGSPGAIIDAIQQKAEAALATPPAIDPEQRMTYDEWSAAESARWEAQMHDTPPAIDPERLARALRDRFGHFIEPQSIEGWVDDAAAIIAAYEAEP